MDDVEDAVGKAGLGEQLRQAVRGQRRSLGGLQHERVAGRDRERREPERDHRREVERGDPAAHTEREAVHRDVHAPRHLIERLALHQRGHPGGQLDHLDPPPHLAAGLVEMLAVLSRHQLGELVQLRAPAAPAGRTCGGRAWSPARPATPRTPRRRPARRGRPRTAPTGAPGRAPRRLRDPPRRAARRSRRRPPARRRSSGSRATPITQYPASRRWRIGKARQQVVRRLGASDAPRGGCHPEHPATPRSRSLEGLPKWFIKRPSRRRPARAVLARSQPNERGGTWPPLSLRPWPDLEPRNPLR